MLLWSSLEDRDARAAALLGISVAIALTLQILGRLPSAPFKPANNPGLAALAGLLCGALAPLVSAGLMLFKNLRHGHIYPDYPAPMLLAMLERWPQWTLAGALAGLGIGILYKLRVEARHSRD